MTDYLSQSIFQPSIPKQLITDEDRRFFEAFSISMDPDGDDKVYLYAENWCTAGVLASEERKDDIDLCEDDLFARFQEIIRRSNGELPWILKESSYSCSRMRPDGFGGSAVFITTDDVQYFGTSSWLEQRIHEAETGDIGPNAEEPDPAKESASLLLQLIEAFPQADPASEFHNEEINGCETVNFLSEFIPQIRDYLDATPPTVAIILEGGLVQCIVSDRPDHLPPMNVMVLDYDTEGADEEELLQVPQKDGSLSTATGRYLGFEQADIGLADVMEQLDARGW